MICACKCARRGLPHGRGVNSLQFNPTEIDLDLLRAPEIVLMPPAGLSPAAVEVEASLRTRFFWPDQDLLVAARVAAEESAEQLQPSGRLRHPGRSEVQSQVPYNQEVDPSASALDDHDKERKRSRCAPSKTAPAPSPT
jgi:hypothetical protein